MDGEISSSELKDLLDSEADVRLVDIRPPGAFAQGHIPTSENIPFGELPQRVEELDDAERIVTVCPIGKSSVQAARLVQSYEGTADATVESLAEGLRGWEYELDAGDGDGERTGASDGGEAKVSEGQEAPF